MSSRSSVTATLFRLLACSIFEHRLPWNWDFIPSREATDSLSPSSSFHQFFFSTSIYIFPSIDPYLERWTVLLSIEINYSRLGTMVVVREINTFLFCYQSAFNFEWNVGGGKSLLIPMKLIIVINSSWRWTSLSRKINPWSKISKTAKADISPDMHSWLTSIDEKDRLEFATWPRLASFLAPGEGINCRRGCNRGHR